MAITWVGASTNAPGNIANPTAALPVGISANDLIIVQYTIAKGSSSSEAISADPSGYTLAAQQQTTGMTTAVYYTFATGTDSNPTMTFAVAGSTNCFVSVYRGVDTTTPFVAQGMAQQSASQAVMTTPTLSNTAGNAWAVAFYSARGVGTPATWTPDAALTEREDQDIGNAGSGNLGGCLDDSAGTVATGNLSYTATYSGATSQATGWLGILAPISSGTSTGTSTGTATWTGSATGAQPGTTNGHASGTATWVGQATGQRPTQLPYKVLLDDDTGTFPYDITAYADLQSGFTLTKGRLNEFDEVQPSTLSMTLDNHDGRFTKGGGNDVYSVHVDQQIRVQTVVGGTTTNRFTGYVTSWPIAWPGGHDYSEVQITAADRLARLSRRQFKSVVQETILQSTPKAYYTLGEAEGSVAAGDISGNQAAALTEASAGTGVAGPTFTTAIAFGQGAPLATVNATDSGTTVYFNPSSEANGKYLTGSLAANFTSATAAIHLTMYTGTVPSAITIMAAITDASGNGIGVGVNTTGAVCAYTLAAYVPTVAITGASVHDDATHDVVLTATNLYLDGASQGTYTQTSRTYHSVFIGGLSSGHCYTQTLSHVAFFNGSPTTQAITDMHNAVNNGFITDRSDQRIARYATWASIPAGAQSLETGTVTTIAHQDTQGMDALTAIQNVVDTEIGVEFIDGSGNLAFQARSHRSGATPTVVFTSDDIGDEVQFLLDNQFLVNYATVTRPLGPTIVALDNTSIAVHERYEWDVTLLTTNDTDSNSIATQKVNVYAEPLIRVPNLTIDLLTQDQSFQVNLLAVQIGDLIKLQSLPSQAPGASFQLFVEGWTETYSVDSWTVEFNTSPNVQFTSGGGGLSWLLDNSTYSILGTSTALS